MPKLKQPPPLLEMAKDRLVDSLAKRSNECSINGSLDELRQVVAFIRAEIFSNIPRYMGADFVESFISRYLFGFKPREDRPESHKRAVLEVVMDRKIVGLGSRVSYLLESMNLEDVHRIRGMRTLRLSGSRRYNLETLHLEDLERFIYVDHCTDADLQIIGKNCPKLNNLRISNSMQVTDNGIAALNSCTELRIVDVRHCQNITNRGIKDFLSAHEKIEEIDFDFNRFSDEGWSVYPSITHYDVYLENISNSNLRLIAEKFPNLTSLKIFGNMDDSACLSTLGSLKKLTDLTFWPNGHVIIWAAHKPLLRIIGFNITGLHTRTSSRGTIASCITQTDLDFLHEFCPNIESLDFNYNARAHGQILVIPPFGCLSTLQCSKCSHYHHIPQYARLQFGVMANLKTLYIAYVEMTTETLESMVLDNDKFPVLNFIRIFGVPMGCDLDRIREIVKNNNIDLRFDC